MPTDTAAGWATDTKFFTNTDDDDLVNRFRATLAHTRFFDVLVGYFRAGGFSLLAEPLAKAERIRILVGLDADAAVVGAAAAASAPLFAVTHEEAYREYAKAVRTEIESAPDDSGTEASVRLLMDFIREGRLEIRGHPSRNIHAKVYITRYRDLPEYGNVVTGSSNFSFSGLTARTEFNVELKDRGDVEFALSRFEELWAEGIALTETFLSTVSRETWLNDSIPPYELYLKFLYEYFRDDIDIDRDDDVALPDGFFDLEYQRQAVAAAERMLEAHNGVFLSDVVGLGKTFISAMLLRRLPGRKLILCPPALKDYWEDSLDLFNVIRKRVHSIGKLEEILLLGQKYDYVLVDESHRFRNEGTAGYDSLKRICAGAKVILVSATPLNNRMGDILAQLKLFQPGRNSSIPGVADLDGFFHARDKELQKLVPGGPEYRAASEKCAALVRDRVLKHVMIRRTRGEVARFFAEDMRKQGLEFPRVAEPVPVAYEFDDRVEKAFQDTVDLMKRLSYARYAPLIHLRGGASAQVAQRQGNMLGFIRSILVKRLESSFFAFGRTVGRMIASHEKFLRLHDEKGIVVLGGGFDIDDLLEADDEGEIDAILEGGDAAGHRADEFSGDLRRNVAADTELLRSIADIWKGVDADPKYDVFLGKVRDDPDLRDGPIIVFTESGETAEHLHARLEEDLPGQSLCFTSRGGRFGGKPLSAPHARILIRRTLDPACQGEERDFRILVATDVLSEGVNLHGAGRLLNYDLPWNPTRVMQRFGRINRLGSRHGEIGLYSFFPTAQADRHLGLEKNITRKIDAFNAVLGGDARLLYETETPDPHGLFGRFRHALDDGAGGDGEEESELGRLQLIRRVRDEEPELYERIRKLPVRARSAMRPGGDADGRPDALLVFFRDDMLRKFVSVGPEGEEELTFLEAAARMACGPDTPRASLPEDYHRCLDRAKAFLEAGEGGATAGPLLSAGDRRLMDVIRALARNIVLDGADRDYALRLREAVGQGALPRKTVDVLRKICKEKLAPDVLAARLRKAAPDSLLSAARKPDPADRAAPRGGRRVVLAMHIDRHPSREEDAP